MRLSVKALQLVPNSNTISVYDHLAHRLIRIDTCLVPLSHRRRLDRCGD